MNLTHLDEVQQFRVKLRAYLAQFVVPTLQKGEQAEVRMDGSTFDRLSVGPHLATNWYDCVMAIGEYARAILFYEFEIRTYPTRYLGELKVVFPANEATDAPAMPKWDPLPKETV